MLTIISFMSLAHATLVPEPTIQAECKIPSGYTCTCEEKAPKVSVTTIHRDGQIQLTPLTGELPLSLNGTNITADIPVNNVDTRTQEEKDLDARVEKREQERSRVKSLRAIEKDVGEDGADESTFPSIAD